MVEDDASVSTMLRRHLVRAGFEVLVAAKVQDAIRLATESSPSVVVLDLALADGDGAVVCQRIRETSASRDAPILVLSARDETGTKLQLFALGADDYVVKPCEPSEIIARIHALVRRRVDPRGMLRVGPLRVGLETGDAWIQDRQLDLTAGERAVLVALARAYPALTPRAVLERQPWRRGAAASNVVEVLIGRLRQKIAGAGGGIEIRAVRGTGYVIRPLDLKMGVLS
ncbi:MAG TPA: response regulator transcription factor [Candidatus Acidoferrales bacterium]|nr:response regulator transcription factor [Candidatus Acidoferrales bacterium]